MYLITMKFGPKREKILPSLKRKKILLLGAAYKDDVSDTRSSPSIFFSNFLKKNNINFLFHDPITNTNDNKKYSISNKLPNFDNILPDLFKIP